MNIFNILLQRKGPLELENTHNSDFIIREIETRSIRIIVRKDNIIEVHAQPQWSAKMDLENALENTEALKRASSTKIKLLVFMSVGKFTKDARKHYASQGGIAERTAVIAKSKLSQLTANFFLGINKPSSPVKLFNEKSKAVEWLNQNKPENQY